MMILLFAHTSVLLYALYLLFPSVIADPPAFFNDTDFDAGEHGVFVELAFKSTALKAPQINFRQWDPECETDKLFFIAPRGLLVGPVGPTIIDSQGHLIWHRQDFGVAYGLNVQKYRGEDVLTFWSGDDMVTGHGKGYHYIFDSSYSQTHQVAAIGDGLLADLHEFKITEQSTAILTVYNKTRADMTYYGAEYPTDGWVWDCLFQEIDIETNRLLFQWSALDHFTFSDCYHIPRPEIDGHEASAFDWFHINSIDKDSAGNYLISARYSHALTYISGETGEILWNIGGKNSTFYDLSDGHATDFKWQHHARWHNGYTTITLFDNAAYFVDTTEPARGMHIHVNTQHMTVKLIREWNHPSQYISESQGSLQMLPNGNAFLGYGSAPVFSEFAPDGTLLCDASFGALHWKESGEFSPGAVMSYRAYKEAWTGRPAEDPRVAFTDGAFFVSWNGDTQTRSWTLERTPNLHAGPWSRIASFDRQGFESSCSLNRSTADADAHQTHRLTARDAAGATLGTWLIGADATAVRIAAPTRHGATAAQVLGLAMLGVAAGVLCARRRGGTALPRLGGMLIGRRARGDAEKSAGRVRWRPRDEVVSGERAGLVGGRAL